MQAMISLIMKVYKMKVYKVEYRDAVMSYICEDLDLGNSINAFLIHDINCCFVLLFFFHACNTENNHNGLFYCIAYSYSL